MEHLQPCTVSYKLFRSKSLAVLELFLSIVIGITIVFPIIFLIRVTNELWRLTVWLLLKVFYGDRIILCDDEIGSNYALMPGTRKMVIYLGEVDGTLSLEEIRENYQKRVIPVYEKLTYTWGQKFSFMCMEKSGDFDIKNHVRIYPGTENRTVDEKELLEKILPDLSTLMEPTKPQWEEVIVPYYKQDPNQEKTQSLRLIRTHHCYMDGGNLLLLVANTFCEPGFPYVIDPCKPLKASTISIFLFKLMSCIVFATSVLQNIFAPPLLKTRDNCRFYVPPDRPGDVLFSWTKKIPMERFQKIKDSTGVSMSAIVSSILACAVRDSDVRYSPERYGNSEEIPSHHPMWLVCGMFPYRPNKLENHHLAIESHMDMSDLPVCDRLAIINEELGRMTKNPLIYVYFWYVKIIGRFPCTISKLFMKLASVPVILSNIPLCTKPVKLWDRHCTGICGWVPLIVRSGLGIVSVRYADHFRYCVQADSTVMTREEINYFVAQLEKQVEIHCKETAKLQRKISTDTSLIRSGNDWNKSQKQQKISLPPVSDRDNLKPDIEDYNNCYKPVNNNNINKSYLSGDDAYAHYSFFNKLKDRLEHIKDGVRKVIKDKDD